MAVLFVMYIPCEDLSELGLTDELDENGAAAGKFEREGGTEEDGKSDRLAAESGDSTAAVPQIQVDPAEDEGKEIQDGSPVVRSKKSLLRAAQSDTGIDQAPESDQGGEDKPLLPSKKIEPTSRSDGLLLSESQKNLADFKEENVKVSIGKFQVSKAPDGLGVDVLRPNGSGRFVRDETKEPIHDITTEVITLREALFEVLDELNIENDVWEKNFDEDRWQIKFVIDTKECDHVLNRLTAFGIGRIAGTSVSVFPASFHYQGKAEGDDVEEKLQEKEEKKQKSEFIKSIKSRLTVAQVVGAVKSNAALTFDFLLLILLASIIAGLGLAESSSVVLVASMLISPLMGPIIGFTFGIVVKNPELWRLGVKNELIGLSICLSFGFLFGLFTGIINNTGTWWGSSDSWPTSEMQARGMVRSLWVGVLIALPSGAGVALSILGGNTGSLVGVAISASLLPPAVNAGMLWGLALVSAISHPLLDPNFNSTLYSRVPPDCHPLNDNEYEFLYSCDMPAEAAILASVSLLLTILNIICIFLMGIVVLKIKEIAPHGAMSPATAAFWKRDLSFARSAYQTIKGRACLDMAKMAKEVIADFKAKHPDKLVENVIGEIQHDPTIYEVPEELPEKTIPEFLRQLSHEGHEFSRQRERNMTETVRLGDRCYHTVINSTAAKKLLQISPSFPAFLECNKPDEMHRKGAVLRFRVNTGTTPESPLSPPVPLSTPDGELLMVNVQCLPGPRKMTRKDRLSARISTDLHATPTVGRFHVKPAVGTFELGKQQRVLPTEEEESFDTSAA